MNHAIKCRIAEIRRGIIPSGYKQTKLGIIPQEWETPELNNVLSENKERNRSGRFGKEDVLSVSGDFGVTNQIELLGRSFAGVSVKDYHVVESGDIVYTKSPLKSNPYGIIKLNKGAAGIVSTLYAVYYCKSHEVGVYLDYYFSIDRYVNNYLRPLVRKGTKNDMKVNNEDVLKGHIILPSKAEILKIAEILGCCDRVIALKKELIAEKKRQKMALMQKLLNPDSGFRLPGFKGEWSCRKLGTFCNTFSGGTPERSHSEYFCGEIPWIKSGELNSRFINATEEYISISALENSSAKMVDADTLLIAMYGATAGTIAITNIKAAINQAVLAIIPDESVNKTFLMYALKNQIDLAIVKYTQGGQPNFTAEIIKAFLIKFPNIKEQLDIADILSAADKEIDLLEQELTQQQQKKKSLMQLLLTGIVRV